MVNGLFVMNENFVDLVCQQPMQDEIEALANIVTAPVASKGVLKDKSILKDVELLFSGWSGLQFDEELLEVAPRLKAIFHAAGSIKPIVTDAFWESDIAITSAYMANAVPVAEYTLSQIWFSFKKGW